MRLQLVNNPRRLQSQPGFTIVEMLIVIPIAILVIAGLVTAMVSMISDTVATNATSTIAYDSQDTLSRIEQDVRVSINFMGTLNQLTSPQGKDDNTAAFQSSANDLILTQQMTTSSPYESTRDLIYYDDQPNDCLGTGKTANRVLLGRVVYFLKTNADSTKTLWRRTIVNRANVGGGDASTVCDTPWQRNSCKPGTATSTTVGSTCQAIDERMIDNVSSFSLTYYTAAGVTTTDPTQALSIQIQLTIGQTIVGKSISKTVATRVSRTNDVAAPQSPSTPTISILNPLSTDYNNPILSTFQWNAPFATYYTVETKVGAGSWSSPVYTTNTYASVSAPYAKTTLSIRVTAYNDYNQSAQSTYTGDTALWSPCSLIGGWSNYNGGYSQAMFTMTSAGIVSVRGLITGGSNNTAACTLPNNFRPSGRLIFPLITDGATYGTSARADVLSDGTIVPLNASSNWFSLTGIDFVPATAGYSWTNMTLQNGWSNAASPWMPFAYTTDSIGRTIIQGVANAGTVTDNTVIAGTLPSGLRPSEYYHLPAAYTSGDNAFGINGPNGTLVAKGDAATHTGGVEILYPSSMSGWSTLPLTNNWAAYSASTYTQPAYRKGSDGLVTVKGLIKKTSGTPGLFEVIGTLPSGYRPKDKITLILDRQSATAPTNAAGRVDIDTNGNILYLVGSTAWTSLDNIKFYADGS